MKQITISQGMIDAARKKSNDMGLLKNSITGGGGNVAGFLGEDCARIILGGKEANTYDYDLKLEDGRTVDVKTKRTTVPPKRYYECSVAEFNTRQKCDYYAFVRVHNDLHTAWFLGVYPKDKYYDDATYLRKGEVDPSNNFTVKSNCYNMAISALEETM
tara:strand:- start:6 stop:482 length:477 start_codon:yes stop_codon:yes gene_type:complete